jgi:hypothetical protein
VGNQLMGILISDFDSTLTRYDFFDLVRKRWPTSPDDDPWEKYVAGKVTHFQALAEIFAAPKPLPSWPGGWDGQPGLLRVQAGSPNTQDLSRNPPALAGP